MSELKDDPTVTSDTEAAPPRTVHERQELLAAGAMLAERYRIEALLGRGGMGEVYRAEDTKLRQTVALKFLPPGVTQSPSRYARILDEVRLARQVTHPNVCRVHDVGEAGGVHFISMEYVDGDDLASLLRRAGRLSQERGVELARQICLGLSAVHERGVLHRDLKPGNIMVDGLGRARLTDFGLAISTDASKTQGDISGTPAYMAPEQIDGRTAGPRTDIYALGLVLYEIFTGACAFQAASTTELLKLQREHTPPPPSELAPQLDASIDELILSCLAKDPERRPGSALMVASALPGGKPLEALVAAGETPPAELVADAGGRELMSPARAWAVAAFVALGMPLLLSLLGPLTSLSGHPLKLPPGALSERARQVARMALAADPRERAWGFEVESRRAAGEQIRFWYREADEPLRPLRGYGIVSRQDPPPGPGHLEVILDTEGRLLRLSVTPRAAQVPPLAADPRWSRWFEAAAVDEASLQPSEPGPSHWLIADERLAWETADSQRIEAGARRGHPVYFDRLGPDTPVRPEVSVARQVTAIVWFAFLALAGLLAFRNVRTGRGDRLGALRLATWAGVAWLVSWGAEARHGLDLWQEREALSHALGRAAYLALLLWVLYMAVEPAIRRRWPGALVSWARVLRGRFGDAHVARDALMGIGGAVFVGLAWIAARATTSDPAPLPVRAEFLEGFAPFVSWLLRNQINAVFTALFLMVMIVGLRALVPGPRVAALAAAAVGTLAVASSAGFSGPLELLGPAVSIVVIVELFTRFGLLSVATLSFFLGAGGSAVPASLAPGEWHGLTTLVWLALAIGLAGWSAYTASGGRLPAAERAFD